MRITPFLRIAALSLCVLAGQAHAEDVRVSVPGGGVLVLPVPAGWRTSTKAGPGTTVSFAPASGKAFEVLVSPLVAPDGRVSPSSGESLRRLVEASANNAKTQSVERSLPVQAFGSGDVQGSYFSATDRAPAPGDFKYMTQGAMSVGGLPVAFTILSNGNAQAAVEPALRMLTSARKE